MQPGAFLSLTTEGQQIINNRLFYTVSVSASASSSNWVLKAPIRSSNTFERTIVEECNLCNI